MRIYESAVVDAPVDAVWAQLRDFNNVAHWHPAVRTSHVEGDVSGRTIGCVRVVELETGERVREQLYALSDARRSYTYGVVGGPLPIADHVSTVSLAPITADDTTFVEWEAEFRTTSGSEQAMADGVRSGTMVPGFAGLRRAVHAARSSPEPGAEHAAGTSFATPARADGARSTS